MLTQHDLIDMNKFLETVFHSFSLLSLAAPGYDRQSSASQLSTARSSNGGWNHFELGTCSFIFPSQKPMYFDCIHISALQSFCRMNIFWLGNADTSWYESYEWVDSMSSFFVSWMNGKWTRLCERPWWLQGGSGRESEVNHSSMDEWIEWNKSMIWPFKSIKDIDIIQVYPLQISLSADGRDGRRSNCSQRNSPRSRVAAFERPSAESRQFERASAEFGMWNPLESQWIP